MSSTLARFEEAQSAHFEVALREIGSGRKQSHWMWFIFPQLRGLGRSALSHRYGIEGLAEAREYLDHPLLRERLERATRAVLDGAVDPSEVFGEIDYLKFVSSMTLFSLASPPDSIFHSALHRLGTSDSRTIAMTKVDRDYL